MAKREGYFERLKSLFFSPKKFLGSVEKEKDYKSPLFFYVKVSLIALAIGFLILILPALFELGFTYDWAYYSLNALFNSLISLGFAFIAPFISAGVIHLGVLIFGGRQGYYNSFKPITYVGSISRVYEVLLGLLALVFALFVQYGLVTADILSLSPGQIAFIVLMGIVYLVMFFHIVYAQIVGIAKYQKLSNWRAALGVFFVPLILLIIAAISVWLYISY